MTSLNSSLRSFILLIATASMLIGCADAAQSAPQSSELITETAPVTQPQDATVVAPTPAALVEGSLASELLASTVRLEIMADQSQVANAHGGGISHGTVKDGRFMITHNHFGFSLEDMNGESIPGVTGYALYRADGQTLVRHTAVKPFTVAAVDAEMLVLDFGELGGRGFFEALGVPSADFAASGDWQPAVGMQLAQVDWDGSQARLEWVTIEEVNVVDGTNVITLSDGLLPGASGGGVFANGRHVANNWSTVTVEKAGSGEVVRTYSVAALNPAAMPQAQVELSAASQTADEAAMVDDQASEQQFN